jgi:purine-binding chemotaxis protein CheW
VRHVVFRLESERFALPLEAVREVVLPHPPFARVPRCPDAVRGAMNLRGRVVAVVDLAQLVGLSPQALEPGSGQVLILDQGKRTLGLLIGEVVGVEPFEGSAEALPQGALVRGVAHSRAGAVTLLSVGPLTEQATRLFGAV